jgi:Trypsin-like peptidase domain
MVRIQYTATSVQLKIDAARIASTQVGKAALSRHKPIRNWSGWAGQVARDVGFKAAMGVSSLGLGGAVVVEKQVEAGIITSAAVDPQIRAFWATYAVANGGWVGYVNTPVGPGSGVHLGNGWVITAGHVVALGGSLNFGTGTNFNTDAGTVHAPDQVILHPMYSNGGNHDLALVHYSTLNQNATITIATSRGSTGSDVWLAGYGTTGTPVGYTTQDGFIRAGTSRLSSGSSLLTEGYDPAFFSAADMRTATRPFDIRGYIGDSGGGVFTPAGELFGIMIAASNPPGGTRTYFLDLTYPENRTWIDSITSIPEPTSLALVAAAGGLLLMRRREVKSIFLGYRTGASTISEAPTTSCRDL